MNETLLQIPGEFSKLTTMKNNTARLTFDTQEVSPDVLAQMMRNLEKFGWLCFLAGERQIDTLDVVHLPELKKREEDEKSPATRLRNSLFVLHKQLNDGSDFENYYYSQMERFITAVKDKLN
jgi:hypothetical protein